MRVVGIVAPFAQRGGGGVGFGIRGKFVLSIPRG